MSSEEALTELRGPRFRATPRKGEANLGLHRFHGMHGSGAGDTWGASILQSPECRK